MRDSPDISSIGKHVSSAGNAMQLVDLGKVPSQVVDAADGRLFDNLDLALAEQRCLHGCECPRLDH